MMTERAKQDRMYFVGKNLKRFGHTLACAAGFVGFAALVPLSAPPAIYAGLGSVFIGLEINNRLTRSYSDLLVTKIGRTIGQQFPLTFNREKKEKICEIIRDKGTNSKTNYISALMTAQILLFTDREKRRKSILQKYEETIKRNSLIKDQVPREHFNEGLVTTMTHEQNLNPEYNEDREFR